MQFIRVKEIEIFEEYEHLLDSLKLNEFLSFCEDFQIVLSEQKIINREQLSTLFKLTTNSKMGISFDSFMILLKHVLTVHFNKKESNSKNKNSEKKILIDSNFVIKEETEENEEIIMTENNEIKEENDEEIKVPTNQDIPEESFVDFKNDNQDIIENEYVENKIIDNLNNDKNIENDDLTKDKGDQKEIKFKLKIE